LKTSLSKAVLPKAPMTISAGMYVISIHFCDENNMHAASSTSCWVSLVLMVKQENMQNSSKQPKMNKELHLFENKHKGLFLLVSD
jgi:hypothetical protein